MEDDTMICSCHQNGGKKIHNYFILETMLPVEYNYLICTYNESANHSITSRFHLNCLTKNEAFEWLEKCSSITKVNFSSETKNNTIYARCLCMEDENRCKTAVIIKLDPSNATNISTMNQSILHEYPTIVIFHYTHDFSEISNMLIEEIDVDDYYDTNDDFRNPLINDKKKPKPKSIAMDNFVHQKLYHLFDQQYNPKQVYSMCKTEIFDLFAKYNTDKIQRPGQKWVYEQFYNYIQYKDDIKTSKELAKLKKKSDKARDNIKKHVRDNIKKHAVTNNPLNSKIDELCKKYVPILPASSPRKTLPEPVSPQKSSKSIQTTPGKNNTPSYIIKFNPEPKSEKVMFPLKVEPNDIMIQNKLPELKIVQNSKDGHLLKVIGIEDSSKNISVPSGVDGIIILANHNQQPKQINADTSISNVSSCEKPLPTPAPPKIRKHPRKPCLKYQDPGEIVFTDRIEDLLSHVKKIPKKSRRKSARGTSKRKKVVKCDAVYGIENVICSD